MLVLSCVQSLCGRPPSAGTMNFNDDSGAGAGDCASSAALQSLTVVLAASTPGVRRRLPDGGSVPIVPCSGQSRWCTFNGIGVVAVSLVVPSLCILHVHIRPFSVGITNGARVGHSTSFMLSIRGAFQSWDGGRQQNNVLTGSDVKMEPWSC